jgi:hypothetical protein
MRRRQLRWLALALLLLMLVAGLAWWLLRLPSVSDADYARIEVGLPLADVEAIIGGRPGNYGGDDLGQYLPHNVLVAGPALGLIQFEPDGRLADSTIDAVTDGFMPNLSWGPGERQFLTIDECKLLGRPVRRVVWTGRDYAIAVQLDADDTVVNACLAKSIREPGFVDAFLARLGIR